MLTRPRASVKPLDYEQPKRYAHNNSSMIRLRWWLTFFSAGVSPYHTARPGHNPRLLFTLRCGDNKCFRTKRIPIWRLRCRWQWKNGVKVHWFVEKLNGRTNGTRGCADWTFGLTSVDCGHFQIVWIWCVAAATRFPFQASSMATRGENV